MDNEHAVIGAILKNPETVNDLDLLPVDFSVESYRTAYQAIIDMFATRDVIDVLTVADRLQRSNPMEKSYWLALLGRASKDCTSSANIGAYAVLVKTDAKIRNAKAIASELLMSIDTVDDSSDAVDSAVSQLMELSSTRKNYEFSISQALKGAVELIEMANDKKGTVGIKTGLEQLDNVLSGFHESDLYIIAARPAMGKTAILLNFLDNSNECVGLISSEQPNDQIGLRMIAINGKVNAHRMRTGSLCDDDFNRITAISSVMHQEQKIWINDKSGISIIDLIRQARKWKHQHGIKALYVDYVQRIKWTDQNMARWEQVGNVVMALKELARELQIPVIALAQINRNVESRPDQRPHMGDIANSSEIEKEADCIMTLYRDEVYDQETQDKGVIEINVLKNRHGPTGMAKFIWDERYMQVRDFESGYKDQGLSNN